MERKTKFSKEMREQIKRFEHDKEVAVGENKESLRYRVSITLLGSGSVSTDELIMRMPPSWQGKREETEKILGEYIAEGFTKYVEDGKIRATEKLESIIRQTSDAVYAFNDTTAALETPSELKRR